MKKPTFMVLLLTLFVALLIVTAGCAQPEPPAPAPDTTPSATPSTTPSTTTPTTTEQPAVSSEPFSLLFAGANPSGGGTWDLIGSGVSECIRKGGGIITLTPGEGVANPVTVATGQAQMAFCQSVIVNAAIQGIEPYQEAYSSVKAIAALYSSAAQILVEKDKGISSLEQMVADKAKVRIAVDEVGSTQELTMRRMLELYGVNYDDIKSWGGNIIYKGFGEASDMMMENRVDMFGTLTIVPTSSIQEVSMNKELLLLDLGGVQGKMEELYGYQPYIIPQSAYDFLEGDIQSFATQVLIIVDENMDEEIAYRITKAISDDLDYFRSVHSNLSNLTVEKMSDVSGVPLHPGALKYYQEAGVL